MRRPTHLHLWHVLLALTVVLPYALTPRPALTAGVVTDCTSASQLEALLLAGGLIGFNCGGAATIPLDHTLQITSDTTIDGTNHGHPLVLTGNDLVRVFDIPAGVHAQIDQLTLTHGKSSNGDGGAIRNRGALVISGATFTNNATGGQGAGIENEGTLTVRDSVFSGNTAAFGGAIATSGLLTITNSLFTQNTTSIAFGGAIATTTGGVVTITGSTFTNNSAYGGGGVINANGPITIVESTFANNYGGIGGAILGGTLTITNSTFSGNSSNGGGGAIANFASMTMTGSTLLGNTAGGSGSGGAIYHITNGTMRITNSTIVSNTAALSGGGISTFGPAILINVTLAGNTSSGSSAGGNIQQSQFGASPTLRNTIVAAGSPVNCAGAILSEGHNIDSGMSCNFTDPTDRANTDPQLAPLADNGGLTQTRAPQSGSPAINSGDSTACPPTDQRGAIRPQQAVCDIGAYEYGATPTLARLSPSGAAVGDPAIILTLTGSGFIRGSVVQWNDAARPTTFVASTQLRILVPATDVATKGTAQVTVANPGPGDGRSNILLFRIGEPQQITFGPLPNRMVDDSPFLVAASASSGLAVSFTADGACSVSDTLVTLLRAGACNITARQDGDDRFAPAPDVAQTFAILARQIFMPLVRR